MYKKSAIELNNLFLSKKVSALEITEYFLKRAKLFDKDLNAFITILEDRAIKRAKELDKKLKEKKPLGKLAGVPIALKDNMLLKGVLTTCGSKFLANYKALYNASVVDFLEEQGAIIIGKTNLDEFAMGSSTEDSAFFKTKNPWDLKCTPGGSSGGSAAAVAARIAPIAFGSDTGGSIRQPAAFTGVVGYKPTYGRVSRYGLVAFGSSLDQIGPFATNVEDIGLAMEVIGQKCNRDSTNLNLPAETYLENLPKDFKKMKIGVPFHFLESLNKTASENFKSSIKVFKDLGGEIIDIDLDLLKYSTSIYYILATAEASTNLARFDGIRYGVRSKNAKSLTEIYSLSREEGFGAEVKRRILLGTYVLSAGYKDAYYNKAQKVRTLIIKAFEKAFDTCDFVIMPTAPTSAFEMGTIKDPIEMYLQDLFTIPANLAGLPAISVPSGFDSNMRPLALQLIAPQLNDVKLIRYASLFEKQVNYSEKVPKSFDKEIV